MKKITAFVIIISFLYSIFPLGFNGMQKVQAQSYWSGTIDIASFGSYDLYLNGTHIGSDLTTSNWNTMDTWQTNFNEGKNVIAIKAGRNTALDKSGALAVIKVKDGPNGLGAYNYRYVTGMNTKSFSNSPYQLSDYFKAKKADPTNVSESLDWMKKDYVDFSWSNANWRAYYDDSWNPLLPANINPADVCPKDSVGPGAGWIWSADPSDSEVYLRYTFYIGSSVSPSPSPSNSGSGGSSGWLNTPIIATATPTNKPLPTNTPVPVPVPDKVKGYIYYKGANESGNITNLPLSSTKISLYQQYNGTPIGSGMTDANGYFEISNLQMKQNGNGKIYVSINSEDDYSRVYLEGSIWTNAYTSPLMNASAGTMDMGQLTIDNDSGAFNVMQTIRRGAKFWEVNYSQGGKFEKRDAVISSKEGSKFFYPKIYINKEDIYEPDTILHEMGHSFMFQKSAMPINGGEHYAYKPYNSRIAYSEGWATYFAQCVQNNPVNKAMSYDKSNNPGTICYNIENLEHYFLYSNGRKLALNPIYKGIENEMSNSAVFWNLTKCFNSKEPGTGFSKVADIMSKVKNFYPTNFFRNDLKDYWKKLFDLGYAAGCEYDIWKVFNDFNMQMDNEPPQILSVTPVNPTVTTNTVIEAVVKDNIKVQKVEFYINDSKVPAAVDTSYPYTYTIKPSDYKTGRFILRVVAYDEAGKTDSTDKTVEKTYKNTKVSFNTNGDTGDENDSEDTHLASTAISFTVAGGSGSIEPVGTPSQNVGSLLQAQGYSNIHQQTDVLARTGVSQTYPFDVKQGMEYNIRLESAGSLVGVEIVKPDGSVYADVSNPLPSHNIELTGLDTGTWGYRIVSQNVPYDGLQINHGYGEKTENIYIKSIENNVAEHSQSVYGSVYGAAEAVLTVTNADDGTQNVLTQNVNNGAFSFQLNLTDGKYTFKVEGKNNGQPVGNAAEYSVVISADESISFDTPNTEVKSEVNTVLSTWPKIMYDSGNGNTFWWVGNDRANTFWIALKRDEKYFTYLTANLGNVYKINNWKIKYYTSKAALRYKIQKFSETLNQWVDVSTEYNDVVPQRKVDTFEAQYVRLCLYDYNDSLTDRSKSDLSISAFELSYDGVDLPAAKGAQIFESSNSVGGGVDRVTYPGTNEVKKAARLNIGTPNLFVNSRGIKLKNGCTYQLDFSAWTDHDASYQNPETELNVGILPYDSVLTKTFKIQDKNPNTYQLEFTWCGDDVDDAVIQLTCNQQKPYSTSIFVTNVSLKEVGNMINAAATSDVQAPPKRVQDENIVDGKYISYSNQDTDGNLTIPSGETTGWMTVDLGSVYDINRWGVTTANKKFRLQYSDDGINGWKDADVVSRAANASDAIVYDRKVDSFTARFVRVYVEVPNSGSTVVKDLKLFYDRPFVMTQIVEPVITDGENIAYNKSCSVGTLVDGNIDNDNDYWVASAGDSAVIDLGAVYKLNRWLVVNTIGDPYYGLKYARGYKISVRKTPTDPWTDMDVVAGNTSEITDRSFSEVEARYVLLTVTDVAPTNLSYYHEAHIKELQLFYYQPKITTGENIAYKKKATASSYDATASNEEDKEYPSKAVDGNITGIHDKWSSSGNNGQNSWLMVDLGGVYEFNHWQMVHAKGGGNGTETTYTRDFKLQVSTNGINGWVDIDSVSNNTEGVTDRKIKDTAARYVRLFISNADADNVARIYEFSLFYDVNIYDTHQKTLENQNGLKATFYSQYAFVQKISDMYVPDFEGLWGEKLPQKTVKSVHLEGKIIPRYTELYTFEVKTNTVIDASHIGLEVNGETMALIGRAQVINPPIVNQTSGQIFLEAGKEYDIDLSYCFANDDTSRSNISVLWSSLSQHQEPIPTERLVPYSGQVDDSGVQCFINSYWDYQGQSNVENERYAGIQNKIDWNSNSLDSTSYKGLLMNELDSQYYNVAWKGVLTPEYSENYTFTTEIANPQQNIIALFINGNNIANFGAGRYNPTDKFDAVCNNPQGTVYLEKGKKYQIEVRYYHTPKANTPMVNMEARVYWESPSQSKEVIPASQLKQGIINSSNLTNGLVGTYFQSDFFNNIQKVKVNSQINFDNILDEGYREGTTMRAWDYCPRTVCWTGTIVPRYSEVYKFYLSGSTEARLWVNDQLITQCLNSESDGSILLQAGVEYSIRVESSMSLETPLKLYWESAQQQKEIVPQSCLFPRAPASSTTSVGVDGTSSSPGISGNFAAGRGMQSPMKILVDGIYMGEAKYNAVTGRYDYSFDVNQLGYGQHDVEIVSTENGQTYYSDSITAVPANMNIETLQDGETVTQAKSIEGWAYMPGGVDAVKVYLDGVFLGNADYGISRPNVLAQYPMYGTDKLGFKYDLSVSNMEPGVHVLRFVVEPADLSMASELEITRTIQISPSVSVKLNYRNESNDNVTNHMQPVIELVNDSGKDIDLSTVKIKYYFTDETGIAPVADLYYSNIAGSNINTRFVNIDLQPTNSLYSFEISFTQGAGILKAGDKVDMIYGIHNNNWTNYTQSNDPSFKNIVGSFGENKDIAVYIGGALVWGPKIGEPVSPPTAIKAQYTDETGGVLNNVLHPVITLVNTGTTAINLSDIKLRYYFTNDSGLPLSASMYWASCGNSNVTTAFNKIINKTDYIEIGFGANAGLLNSSSTVTIKLGINAEGYPQLDQSNDYSWVLNQFTPRDDQKITAYMSNQLAWGIEP
ncbi:MAG: discoidin domain-containing protein [Bacillota bacterium]|nr:discoidin domain-containing protein [Bacillota bacterium]